MIFADFPFLRYLVFFITGILLYPYAGFLSLEWLIWISGSIWFCYLILLIYAEKRRLFTQIRSFFPFLGFAQLLFLGIIFSHLRDFHNMPSHLIHFEDKIEGYMALVVGQDEVKPNSTANRVLLKKVHAGKELVDKQGEVLIYHRSEIDLKPGDLIWIWGKPQPVPGPSNPNEFDYRKFMKRQGLAYRHFIGDRFEVLGTVSEFPIEAFFIRIRSSIMYRIDVFFQDYRASQIAKALLLGQKKTLDRELSDAYATAGAMHVLAVSGLHVGIIYGFFFLWIKPYRLGQRKRILYLSGIILLIWAYALLTGMSPSVMRAATMFSLMALAQMKSRSPSIFNAIALSALILLVFDPMLIYAVGFQLSYVALLGIILIQPILVKIWSPPNKVLDYAWQISTVGMAAQMATFPLSAYYFHIFPSYFLISNLVAIPGAFLIMSIGVPFMLLSNLPSIGAVLAFLTEWIIKFFNSLVLAIQYLPGARLSGIYLESHEVYLYFLFLGLLLWLYHRPQRFLVWGLLFGFFILGGYRLGNYPFEKQKDILTIYQVDNGFAMDYMQSNSLFAFDRADSSAISFKVSPHRERKGVEKHYVLKAFENEDEMAVLLPNGAIFSIKDERVFLTDGEFPVHELHEWKEGKWFPSPRSDSLRLGTIAYKLVFD
jgi:competence protein ComEC